MRWQNCGTKKGPRKSFDIFYIVKKDLCNIFSKNNQDTHKIW